MTTVSRQCRESSTATGYSPLRIPLTKSIPGDYEKRKQLRLEKEKPVLEAFWSWLDQQKPVRNTGWIKRLIMFSIRRDTAETYLEDGRCSFTNNLSEECDPSICSRAQELAVQQFRRGSDASAVVYTMVEMAKAHGLNIYGYLKFCWSTGQVKI